MSSALDTASLTTLYGTVRHCTALPYTTQDCDTLQCTALNCIAQHGTAPNYAALRNISTWLMPCDVLNLIIFLSRLRF